MCSSEQRTISFFGRVRAHRGKHFILVVNSGLGFLSELRDLESHLIRLRGGSVLFGGNEGGLRFKVIDMLAHIGYWLECFRFWFNIQNFARRLSFNEFTYVGWLGFERWSFVALDLDLVLLEIVLAKDYIFFDLRHLVFHINSHAASDRHLIL